MILTPFYLSAVCCLQASAQAVLRTSPITVLSPVQAQDLTAVALFYAYPAVFARLK